MDGPSSTPVIDPLLLPLLQATEEAESQRLLAGLVAEQAEPIIKPIIRHKLHVFLSRAASSRQHQEAEDLYGDVLLHLLGRLKDFTAQPETKAIGDFRSYVAVITFHACHKYLSRKYPRRHQLKNRLRYLLANHPGLALWENEGQATCGGLSAWREQHRAPARAGRVQELRDNPHAFERAELAPEDAQRMHPADLLTAIFRWLGSPVELDDLVGVVADLQGIKDETERTETDEGKLYDRLPDPRPSVAAEVEQRCYLERLWAEICQLPLRQRAALLLNLRDAQGSEAIALLPLTGIATIGQIAKAVGLPDAEFFALWNDLPLEDATIARQLGVTRQQVINLRKSARARLARRMRAFEEEA